MKKILVTGGSGFIGKHLVYHLSKNDSNITVVDRAVGYSSGNIEYICEDIIEFVKNAARIAEFDIIYHLAGNSHPVPSVHNPLMDFNLNLKLSVMLLDAIRKTEKKIKFINISSAAVYGNPEKLPIRECDRLEPLSPYGASKLAVEHYVRIYTNIYNVHGITVRPFSVYGPGLYKQVIYDTIRKLHENPEQIELFGDGSQMRDFLYIEDLVMSLIVIANNGLPGEVYNIASGKSYSINEIMTIMCSIMHIDTKVQYTGTVRSGEPDKWIVDISKLKGLGVNVSTSIDDGIRRTINWYKMVNHK